jgi:plasmid stabilization system protein ParE
MQIVAEHPDVGRSVDNMNSQFQQWPISFGASGYIALYRLQHKTAFVVAVRHHKEVGYQPS